jgi:hypothetical protein
LRRLRASIGARRRVNAKGRPGKQETRKQDRQSSSR